MSSRNSRLSPDGRARASAISKALLDARREFKIGGFPSLKELCDRSARAISAAGLDVEYVEIVDEKTLLPANSIEKGLRILAAARLEGVRLIDNIALSS